MYELLIYDFVQFNVSILLIAAVKRTNISLSVFQSYSYCRCPNGEWIQFFKFQTFAEIRFITFKSVKIEF